jgi:hypothetical protein
MSAAQGPNRPNQYHLRGANIAVTYFPQGAGPEDRDRGPLRLIYQDQSRSQAFFGDEVRTVDVPDLGAIASVTVDRTTDFGNTTFSLLLPVVVLPDHPNASAHIDTQGITTIHPGVFGIGQPQRDLYTVAPLSGTASNGPVPLSSTASPESRSTMPQHNTKATEQATAGAKNTSSSSETPPEKPGNQPKTISYRGRTATLHDPGEPEMPMVSVDGTDVMVRREETGGYSAPMLNMFSTYTTLDELTRSLIDTSPVFLAQRKA